MSPTHALTAVLPRTPVKVAVVTPTFQRPGYLAQTSRYVQAQDAAPTVDLRWFVFDDSPLRCAAPYLAHPRVHYLHDPERRPLGHKRNVLNAMAAEWGADFICAMDDDDWYGPGYVGSMLGLLREAGSDFAGSSKDYYYHVPTGKILAVGAVGPRHSCNAVLCYRAHVLATHRYDDRLNAGEEASFLQNAPVAQHPRIRDVHLALAHAGNTVDKSAIYRNGACHTARTLADFPMGQEDRGFYEGLTREAGAGR